MEGIWVFNNQGSRFAGGVFNEKKLAEHWIKKHRLTGVLTLYPLNQGVYDWAVESQIFTPSKTKEFTSDFVGSFTCAAQDHYHYIEGALD